MDKYYSMQTNVHGIPAKKFNRYGYAFFLLAGLVFLYRHEVGTALIFFGLGPVFDPFDPSVSFGQRPLWQRAWLFAHVIVTLSLVAWELYYLTTK